MDQKHRKVLQTHHKYLVDNLSKIEVVCDCLLQDGILDTGLQDAIIVHKGRSDRIRHLLSTLPRRGPSAFDSFINALKESSNEFILDELMTGPHLGGISDTKKPSDATTKETEKEDMQVSTQKYTENKESTVKNTSTPNMMSSDWPDFDKGNVIITPKHVKKADNYTQILEKQKTYSLKRKIKGKFIFICNVCKPATQVEEEKKQFSFCNYSLDADKVTIKNLFKHLGYDSCICQGNKGREEMKQSLQEKLREIEAQKDSCYDSLVVTILSCGVNYDPGKIYDKDGDSVPLTDITDLIKESQAFKDKPKVVIVQTYSFKDIPCDKLDSAMQDLKIDDCNTDNLFVISSVPKPDYGPWMVGKKLKGSYFIQALAHVICNHSHEMSFLEIIEEVNRCLSDAIVPAESGERTKKSVAEVVCLQYCKEKELYFFPGLQKKETL